MRPTKEDIKQGLTSALGRDFAKIPVDAQEMMTEVFHSIIHDDKHPISITKSLTLKEDIKKGVSSFMGRHPSMNAPHEELMVDTLYEVVYSILHPGHRFVREEYCVNRCALCKPLKTRSQKAAILEAKLWGLDDERIKKYGTRGRYLNPLACSYEYVRIEGKFYKRITESNQDLPTHCHGCCISFGNVHHIGCDVESCPKCHYRFVSCEHSMDTKYYTFGKEIEDIEKVCTTCHEPKRLAEFEQLLDYEISKDQMPDYLTEVKECRQEWMKNKKYRKVNEWLELDLEMSSDILGLVKESTDVIPLKDYQLSWLRYLLVLDKECALEDVDEEQLKILDRLLDIVDDTARNARADECGNCCEMCRYK